MEKPINTAENTDELELKIRKFFERYYDDERLKIFCSRYFQEIGDEMADKWLRSSKIEFLIKECRTHDKLSVLSEKLYDHKPEEYIKHFGIKNENQVTSMVILVLILVGLGIYMSFLMNENLLVFTTVSTVNNQFKDISDGSVTELTRLSPLDTVIAYYTDLNNGIHTGNLEVAYNYLSKAHQNRRSYEKFKDDYRYAQSVEVKQTHVLEQIEAKAKIQILVNFSETVNQEYQVSCWDVRYELILEHSNWWLDSYSREKVTSGCSNYSSNEAKLAWQTVLTWGELINQGRSSDAYYLMSQKFQGDVGSHEKFIQDMKLTRNIRYEKVTNGIICGEQVVFYAHLIYEDQKGYANIPSKFYLTYIDGTWKLHGIHWNVEPELDNMCA